MCFESPAGTYQSGSDPTKCTPCPPGTYSTTLHATSASTCVKCSSGTTSIAGSKAISACTNCGEGYYGFGGLCYACEGGYSSSVGATSCTPCKTLQFTSGTGGMACTSCTTPSTSVGYSGWKSCISADEITKACPNGPSGARCSGHGTCVYGICHCVNGCEDSQCSTGLCSGTGTTCDGYIEFVSPSFSCVAGKTCNVQVRRTLGSVGNVSFQIQVTSTGSIITTKSGSFTNGGTMVTVNICVCCWFPAAWSAQPPPCATARSPSVPSERLLLLAKHLNVAGRHARKLLQPPGLTH